MNVSALFIDRPVATTLLAIAIFLSGVLGWFHLPVAKTAADPKTVGAQEGTPSAGPGK